MVRWLRLHLLSHRNWWWTLRERGCTSLTVKDRRCVEFHSTWRVGQRRWLALRSCRGQSLFAFGYQDGVGDAARFQHPLGVAQHGQTLFVADSYNHRIRRIDLNGNAVTTWQGDGTAGNAIQPLQLSEPGGLAYAGGDCS